jgi:hypothetical protein
MDDNLYITAQAVVGCGHASTITTTIDDAGPDVAMALNELCPLCEREHADHQIEEYENDDGMDACFHCHNLNLSMECGSCSDGSVLVDESVI